MEQRPLDITVVKAKGLKDVGAFSKMDVYVVVSISTNPGSEQKTPVDEDGGSSPKWKHLMRFVVDEPSIQMNRAVVIFRLRHERKMLGDKDIGEVQVVIQELLDKAGEEKDDVEVEYPVVTPSGKEKGSLKFSFKFGEVYKVEDATFALPPAYAPEHDHEKLVEPYPEQAPAYYAPPPAYDAPYAAPHGGYPQGPPPQYGYGGPYQQPPPGGYPYQGGYQQPGYDQHQNPEKSGGLGVGAGLGIGLAGGLVGGMIIGDMIDDASEDAFDDSGDS